MGTIIPIKRADGSAWANGYIHRALERKEEQRLMYVRRRRALLWTPLMAVGAVLLVWQITSAMPVPALVYIGIGLCMPWVVDC